MSKVNIKFTQHLEFGQFNSKLWDKCFIIQFSVISQKVMKIVGP